MRKYSYVECMRFAFWFRLFYFDASVVNVCALPTRLRQLPIARTERAVHDRLWRLGRRLKTLFGSRLEPPPFVSLQVVVAAHAAKDWRPDADAIDAPVLVAAVATVADGRAALAAPGTAAIGARRIKLVRQLPASALGAGKLKRSDRRPPAKRDGLFASVEQRQPQPVTACAKPPKAGWRRDGRRPVGYEHVAAPPEGLDVDHHAEALKIVKTARSAVALVGLALGPPRRGFLLVGCDLRIEALKRGQVPCPRPFESFGREGFHKVS